MRFPNDLAGFAPEADLRTVVIRRRDSLAQADDAKPALARSELPDGLFFTKGLATTEGFRPSYWSYGKAQDIEDEAQSSGGPIGRNAPDPSPEDGEFSGLERAFLELHRQALTQGPEPGADCDGTPQPETLVLVPGDPDFRAPIADLRTVQRRRSARDTARVDELFARKSHPGAEQTGDAANAAERGMDVPRQLPALCDHTPVVGPGLDACDVAAPMGEPSHSADDRAGAIEAPRVVLDDMPDDAAGTATEHPHDAVREPAAKPAGKIRKSAVAPVQVAVIVFGCVALLASLGVFIPADAPPPRAGVAVQQPEVAAPDAHPVSDAVAAALARGDERMRSGDVVTARLFYEKAADAGNAHGALMMGATFDPKFLASIGVYGLRGDEKAALAWYRRAGDLGDPEAAKLATDSQRK